MAENNDNVKYEQGNNGSVSFATDVIATIVGLAAAEVEGVAEMVTPNTGLAEKLTRRMTGAQNKNFTKGVKVEVTGQDVAVDVSFIVEYGMPIPQVTGEMQENIKKAVETMTGLNVSRIDIHVVGISFEKENQTAAALQGGPDKAIEAEKPEENEPAEAPEESAEEPEEAVEPEEDCAEDLLNEEEEPEAAEEETEETDL